MKVCIVIFLLSLCTLFAKADCLLEAKNDTSNSTSLIHCNCTDSTVFTVEIFSKNEILLCSFLIPIDKGESYVQLNLNHFMSGDYKIIFRTTKSFFSTIIHHS